MYLNTYAQKTQDPSGHDGGQWIRQYARNQASKETSIPRHTLRSIHDEMPADDHAQHWPYSQQDADSKGFIPNERRGIWQIRFPRIAQAVPHGDEKCRSDERENPQEEMLSPVASFSSNVLSRRRRSSHLALISLIHSSISLRGSGVRV